MTEVDVERLAYGGDGVARLPDGRTAFVEGSAPGDRVRIEVAEDRGSYVRATVTEIVAPSPARIAAPCPYYGRCGGCSWQHVDRPAQLKAKRDAVVDSLSRIGRIDGAEGVVGEIVSPGPDYGYRNKVEFVTDPATPRLTLGLHRRHSDEVVPVDRCLLLPGRASGIPKALSGALRYLAGDRDLGIGRVAVRCAANTRDLEIALWTLPGPFPRALAAKTLEQAVRPSSLVRVLSATHGKERAIKGVEVLAGKGHWRERLAGNTYSVSAPSFFQVNTPAAESLVSLALAAVDADGTDRVLDLYAGAGTFTIPLAHVAGEVVSIESAGSAVRDLRRNLERNDTWADVVGGDAAREIDALGAFDVVLVDPPRAGLHERVIAALAARRPRTVVYVSCDPTTLARDAARLVSAGYTLTDATPVDLFPQTYHVETVARFERA